MEVDDLDNIKPARDQKSLRLEKERRRKGPEQVRLGEEKVKEVYSSRGVRGIPPDGVGCGTAAHRKTGLGWWVCGVLVGTWEACAEVPQAGLSTRHGLW